MFVPYLGNLSGLLDQASAHAEARNIDPAVLLNMRLSPTMYSLKQQVGEANRHAVVAGALLAGRAPHTFSDTEPDIAELKARISAAIDFVQGLPRAEIDAAADKEVAFTFKNGAQRKFTGNRTADVQRSAFFHSPTEPDIPELKSRISAAIDFVQGLPRAEIEAAADKEVAFTFKNGAQRKFTGKSLLLTFSVPQFFFHVTTAYDILRHAGVDIAKRTFWAAEITRLRTRSEAMPGRCSCGPDRRRRRVRSSRSSIARSAGELRFRDRRPAGSRLPSTSGR